MQVTLSQDAPLSIDVPLLAFGVFEDDGKLEGDVALADERLGGLFSRARSDGDFLGKERESALFYAPTGSGGPARLAFVGLGRRRADDADQIRRFAAHAVRIAESLHLTSAAVFVPTDEGLAAGDRAKAAAEGGGLAAWDFRALKSTGTDGEPPPPLVEEFIVAISGDPAEVAKGVRVGRAFAEGERLARDLQWLPGNVATPSHLGEIAADLAETYGFSAKILGPEELEQEGMAAILAVSAGSEEEPRLIVLEHWGGEKDAPVIALVGKGLTFDAGGISIKPAAGMEDMKYDMSGGAAVLGAMKAIGDLGLRVNVVGVVPSSENLLSGRATKPGDVIQTRAKKTVEVINTDAEGRLILADALSYTVDHYAPAAMVDCATLTGACVIALGHHAAAVLGNDEELVSELREAGDRAQERCWPLPLWEPYRKQLDSPTADLKNVGGRPAGTITAAWFLSEFVGETRWAHLDIAGTAYGDPTAPYHRKGGFGFPTRLLLEWVRARAE
jgi:leucyl aminopeptidase